MRNGAILAAIAVLALVNGLHLDDIPVWRQLSFVLLGVAAYLHGRHLALRRRDALWPLPIALAGIVAAVADFWTGVGALMSLGLFVTLPWLAGRFRRQQAELVEAGRERVTRLEREREYVAEHARLRERARIASDMHDSLGHELALIALRAGALELAADMTEANREAVARLRAGAVTATDRLRHTVALLRESGVPDVPERESLRELVERAREAGLSVAFHLTGDQAPPPLVDRAAYQVVRESLTNAARYAPGADVLVRVEQDPGAVAVTVTDSASAAAPPPAPPGEGGGSGLAGLRERVRLLGGTFDAGPSEGGFTVAARIPFDREEEGTRR
ncbi:hypothetical protein Skr01_23390 [Sphaerisporangium krabiense]|uniref:histidine kinase n=1 Tax=Sphaerisporangium krabiense TaxID=763782 RepID=A0A7W9DR51_9ACTN|nr:histidine kinase [Sphaerisporangium krabiense]MBB5628088.1 signal transduction histidine kinase [Sphaerisporangium krabiense]GII62254.1 hypothetical protein Skr01_23390 [Sphaerisporangium krabiense]